MRATRTGAAAAASGDTYGTGDGLRAAGMEYGSGVLRAVEGGSGVVRLSALGGAVDLRDDVDADGGNGVVRFSGGGIVDLRKVLYGGNGSARFSVGAAADDRREDEGSSVERVTPTSSPPASKVSSTGGTTAGIFAEERLLEGCRAASSGA